MYGAWCLTVHLITFRKVSAIMKAASFWTNFYQWHRIEIILSAQFMLEIAFVLMVLVVWQNDAFGDPNIIENAKTL